MIINGTFLKEKEDILTTNDVYTKMWLNEDVAFLYVKYAFYVNKYEIETYIIANNNSYWSLIHVERAFSTIHLFFKKDLENEKLTKSLHFDLSFKDTPFLRQW